MAVLTNRCIERPPLPRRQHRYAHSGTARPVRRGFRLALLKAVVSLRWRLMGGRRCALKTKQLLRSSGPPSTGMPVKNTL